tara:strand:- start:9 stop:236 length:228 start_codon:yes stop_codon:yes gene_type:complete
MKRADKKIEKQYLKNSKDYISYRDELRDEILHQKAAILTQLMRDGLEIPTSYAYLLECLRDELQEIIDEHKMISN